jgi:hypothetical protein
MTRSLGFISSCPSWAEYPCPQVIGVVRQKGLEVSEQNIAWGEAKVTLLLVPLWV